MTPFFIFKSLIFFQFLLVSAQDGRCPTSFSCGNLGQITFPFTVAQHPHCGTLAIRGCDSNDTTAPKSIQLGSPLSKQFFNVTYLEGHTITITDNEAHRKNLISKNCQAFHNFSLPPTSPLASCYIKHNITMFKCNPSLRVTPPKSFQNYTNCSGYDIYYDLQNTVRPPIFKVPSSLAQCTQCQVAIRDSPTDDPFEFLSPQIDIEVQLSDDCNKCLRHHGGRCQLDIQEKFHCAKGDKRLAWKLGLDFGLAKICLRKESIVSILGARGTPGYIAPELFSRHFGGVSHKSDVYSYGMMVLEMVGRRKNIKVEVDCSSELYFPH